MQKLNHRFCPATKRGLGSFHERGASSVLRGARRCNGAAIGGVAAGRLEQ